MSSKPAAAAATSETKATTSAQPSASGGCARRFPLSGNAPSASLLAKLEYGAAPESAASAEQWIAAHDGKFGLFIDGKFEHPKGREYENCVNPANGKHLCQVCNSTYSVCTWSYWCWRSWFLLMMMMMVMMLLFGNLFSLLLLQLLFVLFCAVRNVSVRFAERYMLRVIRFRSHIRPFFHSHSHTHTHTHTLIYTYILHLYTHSRTRN
jgi:hypothetical protein